MSTRHPDPRGSAHHGRGKRRGAGWLFVIGAIIAAILYLRFGKGWGIAGSGDGPGSGAGLGTGAALISADAGQARCTLRLAEAGLTLDGKPATRDEAIAACKGAAGGAEVTVTGDARQGDWDDLRAALEGAGIAYTTREPRGTLRIDAGVAD